MAITPTNYATKADQRTPEQADDISYEATIAFTSRSQKKLNTTVPLYSLSAKRLLPFLEENRTKRIAFIDARLEEKYSLQFPDANHFGLADTIDLALITARVNQFKKDNPQRFWDLFLKDFVIVYCTSGSNRSPVMMMVYADAYASAEYGTKNINQKIIFVKGGIHAFEPVDKVPRKFLVPWKEHGKDTELMKTQPSYSTGPGQVSRATPGTQMGGLVKSD